MINALWQSIYKAIARSVSTDPATAAAITNEVLKEIRGAGLRAAPDLRSTSGRSQVEGVPKAGDIAFSSGWSLAANPFDLHTVEHRRWISDWWRANADAFEDHVYSHEGDDLGRKS